MVSAPVVTIVFALIPFDLPRDQHLLAAILLGVIVLWITEPVPIPVGGLIGIAAIVFFGVVPAREAVAPFGSTTVFTFIGAFILAQAMMMHGVARRIAYWLLGLPGVAGFEPVSSHSVGQLFVKSVLGVQTGRVFDLDRP